jgi:type VI secretion system VgrG family protein
MSSTPMEQLTAAVAAFSSASRLYELSIGDSDPSSLLVEAFAALDEVQGGGVRDVIFLSTSTYLELEPLLGQPAALDISLADGTRSRFAGEVKEAALLGSDGGLARYRIRIAPWLWRLGMARNSRVWQDKSIIEIVEAVFAPYAPAARWRWSDDVPAFMDGVPPRSYCCQYRESDLDFVQRILADESLCWRVEQAEGGPCMVLFADSSQLAAVPEDASSEGDGGIRYHGVGSGEQSDTVQSLVEQRRLHASLMTVLSSDYKAKQAVAASSPSHLRAGRNLPLLESCDVPGQYAFANRELAQHYADLRMEAQEARSRLWRGRSTVRTLCAGTRLNVRDMPREDAAAFTVLRVWSVGVNNMPTPAQQALAELFGPIPELLEETVAASVPEDFALAIAQARETGYANCFEALPAELPWRPRLTDSVTRPTAYGAQSAIVIGADGSDEPGGADELYCDRLGRVRIRYHWQDLDAATCWVRVAQRAAGGGMGCQFLPRIGQEVLVQFLENDINRPIIVGALYNGRGEGGIAPTPGGQAGFDPDESVFGHAHDHAASAQGNLAGGNSPVWHGASGDTDGHRNRAAQWGVRSKEFGGSGYNQLLFDDTDGQGRVQLRSTHAASELNLGHLVHAADNYRGSFRGLGAELRTDHYGAVRGGAGLLVSSYRISHGAASRDAAGDNPAGVAMMNQAIALASAFDAAALTHQTVGLAAHAGSDDKAAPLKALLAAMSGTVARDGATLPHTASPIIAISAQDGLGVNADQGAQLANGETLLMASGQDTQFVSGGQMRMQTGQAIGVLGGAVKPGEGGVGLQLIAARDAVDIQAQGDTLKVQARDEVNVISANAHIDWAAAKRISLSTAGGANITIEGGNIKVQCPGKILVQAGKKSFLPPAQLSYKLPILPQSVCLECLAKRAAQRSAFINKGA